MTTGAQATNLVSYPERFYNNQHFTSNVNPNPPFQAQLAPASGDLSVVGAWADESARPAQAGLAPSSDQVPTESPPAGQDNSDVEMAEEGQKKQEPVQPQAGSKVAVAAQPPAKTLIKVTPGTRPPPERDPSSSLYQYLGIEQKELDQNALKLWKQEERLQDFEIIFGTRDPYLEPTNATEEFYSTCPSGQI